MSSISRVRGWRARLPTLRRPRTTARASSPARSGRPTALPRSRLTCRTPAFAPSPSTSWRAAYGEQVKGLIDGGADLLLIETIFDTLNAKAAICAIMDASDARGVHLPVMISGTITDRSGRSPVRPDAGGVLEFDAARGAVLDRGSTARSAPRRCARILRRSGASPTRWSVLIRTRGCRTSSAATMKAPNTWRAPRRVRGLGPRQRGRRLLRHHARSY